MTQDGLLDKARKIANRIISERKSTDTAWTRPGYIVKMPDSITYKVADSILVDNVLTVVFLPLPDHATIDSKRGSYVKDKDMSANEYEDNK